MNIIKLSIITLSILGLSLLTGCASTGVIPLGNDSYMIGKKDGSPGIGVSFTVKAEVYQEANDFCEKKGLVVETLKVNTLSALPGRLGSTELQFRCTLKTKVMENIETKNR